MHTHKQTHTHTHAHTNTHTLAPFYHSLLDRFLYGEWAELNTGLSGLLDFDENGNNSDILRSPRSDPDRLRD